MMLDRYPLSWGDPRLQEVRNVLAAAIWRVPEIETVVRESQLGPENIAWSGSPRGVWTAVFDYAASQLRLRAVIDEAGDREPALRARLDELLGDKPLATAQLPGGDPAALDPGDARWKGFTADGRERRMVETDDTLLDVAFLARGVLRAAAVCRLEVSFRTGLATGTGFRIGPKRLLSNHHVLHDWDDGDAPAVSVGAGFGYELDLDGKLRTATLVDCDVATIRGEREHDFAVIDTAGPIPDEAPVLSLDPRTPVKVDDRVVIIQHPEGLPKKVALAHNLVRHVDDDVVQYWTDTDTGSSGSPVFNERWEVVALHHWWVESPADDGSAYRNQGRNIRRVAERLAALDGGGGG